MNWENHPPDTVPSDLAHGIGIVDLATGYRRDILTWEEGVPESYGVPHHVIAWSRDSRWLIMAKESSSTDTGLYFYARNVETGKDAPLWQADRTVGNFAWHEGPPPTPLP